MTSTPQANSTSATFMPHCPSKKDFHLEDGGPQQYESSVSRHEENPGMMNSINVYPAKMSIAKPAQLP
jgi:hypothetical protein